MYEQLMAQPELTFDYLAPLGPHRVTPQAWQNLMRPTNKGSIAGLGACCPGCAAGGPCEGGTMLGNALAGVGRCSLRGHGVGQYDAYVMPRWLQITAGILSLAGAGLGAYHGYKRYGESGWGAFGWFLLGGMFPVIAIPVMFAQGFGQRK